VTGADGVRLSEEAMRELEDAMMEQLSNGKPRINTDNTDQIEKTETRISLSVF
jgi:hypothetical protein